MSNMVQPHWPQGLRGLSFCLEHTFDLSSGCSDLLPDPTHGNPSLCAQNGHPVYVLRLMAVHPPDVPASAGDALRTQVVLGPRALHRRRGILPWGCNRRSYSGPSASISTLTQATSLPGGGACHGTGAGYLAGGPPKFLLKNTAGQGQGFCWLRSRAKWKGQSRTCKEPAGRLSKASLQASGCLHSLGHHLTHC